MTRVPPDRADFVPDGVLPDVLARALRVLFCGINPGRVSAAARAHFANPRNDFWRLLHAAGFTPRLLEPAEQHELPVHGVGVTNAARRTTPGSGDLRRADFAGAAERLARVAEELDPAWIGFVGKEAYRGAFGERPELGLQQRRLGQTRVFVLPSTSPANAAVPWPERLRWFSELARLSEPTLRPAVRAVLLDPDGRVFLHRFRTAVEPGVWITPGGALEPGEDQGEALRRELREELRLDVARVDHWIWRRRHVWRWASIDTIVDTRETFALIRDVDPAAVRPTGHDVQIAGPRAVEEHRWWTLAELEASADAFAPGALALHLRRLLQEGPPPVVVDVGL